MNTPLSRFTPASMRPTRRRRSPRSILSAAVAFSLPLAVKAAVLVWDTSPAAAVQDGSGIWDSALNNWTEDAGATNTQFTSGSDVRFGSGGTAGTITFGSNLVAGSITFDSVSSGIYSFENSVGNTFSLAINGGIAATATASFAVDIVLGASQSWLVGSGQTLTVNGVVSDGGNGFGLTKDGRGALVLTNPANSFSGPVTIDGGSIIVTSQGSLGTGTSAVVVTGNSLRGDGGGALVIGSSNDNLAGLTWTRDLALTGGGPTGDGTALNTVGNNIFTGNIVTGGNIGGLNPVSGVPVTAATSSGAITRLASTFGTATLTGGLDLEPSGQTVQFGGNGNWGINSDIVGAANFEKAGSGLLILNGNNTGLTGTVSASGGFLRVSSGAALGSSTSTGAITINSATLEIRSDAPDFADRRVTFGSASPIFFVDREIGGSGLNQTVLFSNPLTIVATTTTRTYTFNSRNGYGITFTGNMASGSRGASTFTNNGNGEVAFNGSFWNTTNTTGRTVTLTGAGDFRVGSVLASGAAHSITKTGNGTLTMTGTGSTYTGATNINGGTVAITDFRAVTNNTAAINIGTTTTAGTLSIIGNNVSAANLTTSKVINLGGTTGGATLLANQTGTSPGLIFNASFTATGTGAKTLILGGTNTLDNDIRGAIVDNSATNTTALTKNDPGTWMLSGSNTYSGATAITDGRLKIKANAATSTIINDNSPIAFLANGTSGSAGGILEFVGQNGINNVETLATPSFVAGAATLKLSPGAAGTASLIFTGNAGVGNAAGVNVLGSNASNTITLTGAGTGLVSPNVYFAGANFAYAQSDVLRAPEYGIDPGFVTSGGGLTASSHNEITGSFSTAGMVLSSLKIKGSNTLTLSSGTLTVQASGAGSSGGILATDGSSVITGGSGISAGGAGALVFRVDGIIDVLTLETPLTSGTTGGFTKNGLGTLVIQGVNAQTGATNINEGTVQLSGSGRLSANSAAFNLRQNATLDLNGLTTSTGSTSSSIGAFNGAGTITNSSTTTANLTVGGGNGTGIFAGLIQDGVGEIDVTKRGTGGQTWSGLNTYTGITTIDSTGIVSVPNLSNLDQPSGIGRGDVLNNAGSLVFTGASSTQAFGGLSYTGRDSIRIDRLFTFGGAAANSGARIQANGVNNATLIFNNFGALAFGTADIAQGLVLGGASLGDNQFNPLISNNGTGIVSLYKSDAGLWILGNTANSYTGVTQINAGALRADGTTLPAASPLVINGGVLQSSGSFTRALTTTPAAGTGTINWNGSASGGFAASTSKLTVNIGGNSTPDQLTWATGGFVGGTFILGSTTSLAEVEVVNPIDLNGAARTVQVDANSTTGSNFATLSGLISGGGSNGLTKTGSGILQLLGNNTYTGNTLINGGTVQAVRIGDSASTASNFGAGTGFLSLGTGGTSGTLAYVGSGETTDRQIRLGGTTASVVIESSGTGALVLSNVTNASTGTSAKTLFLRGDLNASNEISSVLSNNSAGGALNVTKDDNGTWILSGDNTYSGTTTISAGSFGFSLDSTGPVGGVTSGPVGRGTLVISNGSLFALGGDRTLNNDITFNGNASSNFIGTNSITLNGNLGTTTGGNTTVTNSLPAGKFLTINSPAYTGTETSSTRSLVFNGSGHTILNSSVTDTAGGAVINLLYNGYGSLTLGGSNGVSTYSGSTTITSGTLKLGSENAIPNGAGKGSLIINPGAGLTATLDLNGFNQTINGITANSAGMSVLDNSAAAASTLTIGANDQAVTFVGGTINTGSGALSIAKTGTGAAVFSQGPFGHTGTTMVTSGSLVLGGDVTATTSLVVSGANSVLSLTGGHSGSSFATSVMVGAGAELNLFNGLGQPLDQLTSLTLGAGSVLSLNAGATSDTLTLLAGNVAAVSGAVTLNIRDTGSMVGNSVYQLLAAPGGGLIDGGTSAGSYLLSQIPGGFTTLTLNQSDTLVSLTTGSLVVSKLYWTGATDAVWNTVNGTFDGLNWSPDKTGASVSAFVPGAGTTVVFQADSAAGGAVTTALEQGFRINNLEFEASTNPATAVTINPGVVATNKLTIDPSNTSSADGILLKTGGPAAVTIAGPVGLGSNQTWTLEDANSTLTVGGALSGSGNLVKAGAGKAIISVAADPTFAATTVTVNAGFLEIGNVTSLGSATLGNLAAISINPGAAFYYNNTTSGTVANPIALNGGTLSAGGATQTYSSAIPIAVDSTINFRDSASPVSTTTARSINLTGALSGPGKLTLESVDTVTSGNQETGTLTINNNGNSGWSGGVLLHAGTIVTTVENALGTGDLVYDPFGRIIVRGTNGQTYNLPNNIMFTGLGEFSADNTSSTLAADFTINLNGVVTVGSVAGPGVARLELSDTSSLLNLNGGVILANNASISVGNGDRVVTIAGPGISETGGARILTINDDSGGWAQTNRALAINAAGSYTGGTILSSGTLILGHVNALGSGDLTVNVSSSIQAGIDLSAAGSGPLMNNLILSAATTTISGANNLTFGGTTTVSTGNSGLSNNLPGGAALILNDVRLAEAGTARTLTTGGSGSTTIVKLLNPGADNTLTNNQATGNILSIGDIFLSESATAGHTLTLGGSGATLVTGVIANVSGEAGTAGNLTKAGTGTLTLTNANTFNGGITITGGVLEFSTVNNNGGGASNLGTGSDGLTLSGGALSFIGDGLGGSQSTDRAIATTTSSTLAANGTNGATITYAGAITQAPDNSLTLTGAGAGTISGGIVQPAGAASADLVISTGDWTLTGANSNVADDILLNGGTLTLHDTVLTVNDDTVVTGGVLNLNTTGVWKANNVAGTSSGLYARNGGVINLNASDVNGGANSGGLDFILLADTTPGAAAMFNTNTFGITTPRLDVGGITEDLIGNITGTGTITLTSTVTDYSAGLRTFRGSIAANLAGVSALLKQGLGDVTLSGDNSDLTGTVAPSRLDAGNLILDYATDNHTKISSEVALDLRGATLTLQGGVLADTVQDVNGLTLASGGESRIVISSPGTFTTTLNLGNVTRSNGAGTIRFQPGAAGTVTTTAGKNSITGLLGSTGTAYATFVDPTGTYFATTDVDGHIVPLTYATAKNDVTTWFPGDNITDEGAGLTGGPLGGTIINSLRFDAANASSVSIAGPGVLNISSGGILSTDHVNSGSLGILGGTLVSGTGELVFTHDSSQAMTVSADLRGTTILTKSGPGTLILTGTNDYSGATLLQNGTLRLSGGNAIGDTSSVVLADDHDNLLQLLDDETIGRLSGGSASTGLNTLAVLDIGGHTLTINQVGGNTTYAGLLTGSGTIIKEGSGTNTNLGLTGLSSGFTGTININGGLFQLAGVGAVNASDIIVNKDASLLFDNNGTTRSGTRVLDNATITLNSADGLSSGSAIPRGLWIRTDQDSTTSTSETVGIITFASGASYAGLEQSGGTSSRGVIIADNFVRLAGATLDVRGRALGSNSGGRSQLRIGTTANQTAFISGQLVGGGGATATSKSIVPWVIAENTTANLGNTNMGNSLATYVSGLGFTALNLTTDYAPYTGAATTDNVRESLTADLTGLTGQTINALVVQNDNTATSSVNVTGSGAGQVLAITSGALLFTLNPAAAASAAGSIALGGFDGGITVGATNEYVVHVVNPSVAANAPTLSATIASPLTSIADLTKSGLGTLVLTAVNTAGGGTNKTTLNEGALEISDLDNLGGNTGSIVFAGGTLRLSSTYSGDDLSLRPANFLTGGGTLDTNGMDLTLGQVFGSGVGSFAKAGAGTLTLNGVSYTGATRVLGGTLRLGMNQAIGTADLIVNNGTFDLNGFNATVGRVVLADAAGSTITGAGTLTSNGSVFDVQQGSIASVLAGTSKLVKSTASTVILSGVNTYTGPTELNAGVLEATSLDNLGVNPEVLFNGGTLRWATGSTYDLSSRTVRLLTGVSSFDTNGSDVTFASSIGGGGAGGLVKLGTGTLTLGTANNYTGATTVNAGVLRLAHSLSLGLSSSVTIANTGSVLELGDGVSLANPIVISSNGNEKFIALQTGATAATIDSTITIGESTSGNFRVDTNGGTITINGVIGQTSTGGLRKVGAGTLILTAANTYSAVTQVFGGTLQVNSGSNISTGALTVQEGVLDLRNGAQTVASLTAGNGAQDSTSAVLLNGGVLTLGGNVAYTASTTSGTATLSGGMVELGATRTFTVNDSTATDTEMVVDAVLTDGAAIGGLTKSGNGTLVLGQSNTYSGPTSLNAGLMKVNAAQNLAGQLNFGSSSSTTTTGTLDLTTASASFGSMLVQTNSATNVNQVLLGAGQSLTINGNVTLGTTASSSTTLFTASGAGEFHVVNPTAGATFGLGANTSNSTTADFSALPAMSIDLNTTDGLVRVSSTSSTNVADKFSVLLLANDSTITASALTVGGGGSYGGSAGQVNAIKLGGGATVLRVNTLNLGTGIRDFGAFVFNGATGTLNLRDPEGAGRVAFNIGTGSATTGVGASVNQNTFDVTGHVADLLFSAVAIGTQNRNSNLANVFSFDQGTLDMTSLTMSTKGSNGSTTTSTMNLGGGTVRIGSGSGTAITLAGNSGPGTADATIIITGGTVTVTGDIVKGNNSGAGSSSGALTLDGGLLDLSGFALGGTNPVALTLASGTLQNVAEINNGAALTKTTGGVLTIDGTNSFSGQITISAGSLLVHGTSSGLGGLVAQSGTLLGGHGSIGGTAVIESGATLAPGASAGLLTVGGLTLQAGSLLDFELANPATSDSVVVTGTDTLSILGGQFTLSLLGSIARPGTYTLVDYNGTPLSSTDFANLTGIPAMLGINSATVTLLNNTANTSVDLLIEANRKWTGQAGDGGHWNLSSVGNWTPGGKYFDADSVTFDDTALGTTDIVLDNADGDVAPTSITFDNSTLNYTLGGAGALAGDSALTKLGSGTLTLNGSGHTFTGGVNLTSGTLVIGSSSTGTLTLLAGSGPLGRGTLTLGNGVTLRGTTGAPVGGWSVANAVTIDSDFTFGGTDPLESLTLSGPITLADGTHQITVNDADVTATLSGAISEDGLGGITKVGDGTLVLANAGNNYRGTTAVNGGVLQAGADDVIPNASPVVVNSGGILDLFGHSDTIGSLAGAGTVRSTGGTPTLTIDDGAASETVFSGRITQAIQLVKTGAGKLTLSGADSDFTGGVTLGGGTLVIGANSSATLSPVSGSGPLGRGTLTIQNGATLQGAPGGAWTVANPIVINGDFTFGGSSAGENLILTGPVDLGAAARTLSVNAAVTATLSGIVSGEGGLTKAGPGTLVLGGANTYGGATTVSAGTLALGASDVLPDGAGKGSVTVDATLDLAGHSDTINALSGTGTVDNAADATGATLTIGATDATSTFTGTLTNSGAGATLAVVKIGTGTLTLGGTNTFTGGMAIAAGTVSASTDENLGAAPGALTFSGASTLAATGTFTSTRPVALDAAATLDVATSQAATVSGAISGSGSLKKSGDGTLVLGNPTTSGPARNSYAGGTMLDAGTLSVSHDTQLGQDATPIAFTGAATLQASGSTFDSARPVNLGAGITGTVEVTGSAANLGGVISGATGTLRKTGAGELVLTNPGANTYGGGTTLDAGTLSLSQDSNLGTGAVSFTNSATLKAISDFESNRSFTLAATGTFAVASGKTLTLGPTSELHGSAGMIKSDSGTLVVSSNNSGRFTGTTTIDAGTYVAANASGSASGDGNLTVNAAGTLAGIGLVTGGVSVSGTLAPGLGIGTLSTGSLALSDGATFSLEIKMSDLTGDRVSITGDFSLSGTVTLALTDLGTATTLNIGDRITFATYLTTWNGGKFSIPGFGEIADWVDNTNPSHFTFEGTPFGIDYDYADPNYPGMTAVSMVVVPEAGSLASLAAASGLLLGLQRIRRRPRST